jgi:N-acetylneuraminic acid mutarotase
MAFAQQAVGDSTFGTRVWTFGGVTRESPLTYSNQLWSLSVSNAQWSLSTATGAPLAAVGSAMCAVGNKLYYFGGLTMAGGVESELYTFDTNLGQWAVPGPLGIGVLGTLPSGRAYHAMACANGRAYMFGGQDATSSTLGDFHALDAATMAWVPAGPHGSAPTARKGHTLTHSGERLYLFGGTSSSGEKLNDVYSLNLNTLQWRALQTSGDRPTAREGHTAVVLDESLFVFAGVDRYHQRNDVHALSLASLRWSQPKTAGKNAPDARWGHLGALANEHLYIYGGVGTLSGAASGLRSQALRDDVWVMSTKCAGTAT